MNAVRVIWLILTVRRFWVSDTKRSLNLPVVNPAREPFGYHIDVCAGAWELRVVDSGPLAPDVAVLLGIVDCATTKERVPHGQSS